MTVIGGETGVTQELLAIERTLWTNDPAVYDRTLVPDALLVFAETGVLTKDEAIAAIREENRTGRRWGEVALSDARAIHIGSDGWLLTYRADAQWAGEPAWHRAYCSSAYVRAGRRWMLAFHQQSALG
jgi:hypothetical protein